ncbi:C45 family autoproteolytic acyltransferase/hydrolase [Sulfitobacter sp. F26204]|uniref:C45 family autoproteolytic acyltransferase/hydolase n=1 Tax=Sulfitobacter sp. F26204 TaxID=2996014 RepID=UPI00225DD803|nr:C45 family peptidase [Sulfitobacter sp. F26204]MCX7561901.1 C45 family autoproteolytic acyltransferase/hydrolase [Sulfitobacter sp. F26204]
MNDTAAFPYIEIEGDPETIGKSYGRKAMERIFKSLEIYRPVFETLGLSWDAALSRAATFITQLESFDLDQATELRGIAKGAGIKPEEVMIINARTDIIYGSPLPQTTLDDGCTGAIVMPEITANGHLIHGQNWDWRDDCKDSVVIMQRHPATGPATLNLVEAGTLARCGLNEYGIALTANYLQCDHDTNREPTAVGVPSPFVRRRLLSARHIATAAEAMMNAPRSFSNNIMLSDAVGVGINLETTPREYYWIKPKNGLLVHANHFTSVAGRARVFDTGLGIAADSLYREDRVRDALFRARGQITVQTVLHALADDFAKPISVNRPPSNGPGGDGCSTVASIVMDVTEGTMTVVATPYVQSQSVTYKLTKKDNGSQ